MNKQTPQQFLDSTDFKEIFWATSFLFTGPILTKVNPILVQQILNNLGEKIELGSRFLSEEEYYSIDWSGFDCSKSLKKNIK
jgi:hypothetical protein